MLQAPSPLLCNDTVPRTTQICAQMNWARTFCLLEVHLVPRLSSYWKLQLPQGRVGWICALRGVFHFVFFLVLFTMCHVKNKSSPVASQNVNIVCNIISIQMQYSNQSQSLLTMCHLVRTLKRVLLNNCPFLIFFFFFPITLTRQWHVSTYNTNLCSAQMNWARTFCLLEVHLVPRLSSYWKLQLPQGLMGWTCALRGVLITWNRVTEVIRQISSISVCLLYLEKLSSKSWALDETLLWALWHGTICFQYWYEILVKFRALCW